MVKPIKTEEEQTVVVEQEGSPLDPMDDHGLPSIPESDFPPFGFVARCFKRRSALLERFKRLQLAMSTAHLRAPYHSASVEQLERMAYDDERKDVLDRIEELKALKAELEEKEKQYYRPGELSDQVSLSFQITDEIEREREREKEKERQKRQALAAQARAEAKAAAAAAKGLDTGVSGEKTKPSPSKAQAPKSPSPQKGQTVAATTPLTGVLLDPFTEMTQGRLQQPGQVDAALVAPSVRGTPPYPPSTPIVGHRGPGRPRIHHPPPTTPYTSIAGETSSGPKKKSSLDASKKSRPPPRPLPAQTPPTTSSSPYGPQMVGGGNSASSYPRPPTVNGGPMQQPRPDFGVRPQMAQQPRPPFAMPSPAYPQHQPPPPQQRPPPAHMSSSPHPSSQPTYHAQPPPPHHQQQQYHQSHQAPPPSSGGPPPPHMPQPRPNPAPPQASVIPKSPIPLLIPLAALPRLTALGIQPVPAPHLVPILSETGQPMSLGGPPRPANPNQQEAAVLMGITQATARAANGKLQAQQILHISVVLSKLTSAQLSGLAALMQGLQLEVEQARAAAGSNQPGGGRGPSNPPSRPATGSQPPA
ncbi:hypothetical protein IE53DRAFT_360964 [Violaceomyces palustris]|uniref:Uncharacterized protein n=1 Tax=Violaceomyces palustris TaxID=1673888 RepID=A0ACD0P2B9_9BASI|nr:hypothetical protein IE53DRAFT_360964 [Violaceomyces palustris]